MGRCADAAFSPPQKVVHDRATLQEITIPLAKAAVASVGVFSFSRPCNDLTGPLIFANREETRTLDLDLDLGHLGSERYAEFRLVLGCGPVLAVFFAANKCFVSGVALSRLAGGLVRTTIALNRKESGHVHGRQRQKSH